MLSELWLHGIGHVLLSRQLRNGDVAFACFLVNVWCLGVKDVIINVALQATYESKMYRTLLEKGATNLRPEWRGSWSKARSVRPGPGIAAAPRLPRGQADFGDIRPRRVPRSTSTARMASPFSSPARSIRPRMPGNPHCAGKPYRPGRSPLRHPGRAGPTRRPAFVGYSRKQWPATLQPRPRRLRMSSTSPTGRLTRRAISAAFVPSFGRRCLG